MTTTNSNSNNVSNYASNNDSAISSSNDSLSELLNIIETGQGPQSSGVQPQFIDPETSASSNQDPYAPSDQRQNFNQTVSDPNAAIDQNDFLNDPNNSAALYTDGTAASTNRQSTVSSELAVATGSNAEALNETGLETSAELSAKDKSMGVSSSSASAESKAENGNHHTLAKIAVGAAGVGLAHHMLKKHGLAKIAVGAAAGGYLLHRHHEKEEALTTNSRGRDVSSTLNKFNSDNKTIEAQNQAQNENQNTAEDETEAQK